MVKPNYIGDVEVFHFGLRPFVGSRELIKQEEKVVRLHLQSEDVKAKMAKSK